MKKKKILTLVTALVLVGAVGIGATLAYFTDKADAKNTITMGHVDIDLDEPGFDKEDGKDDKTIEGVVPGDEIKKDPTITVKDGSLPAYIRAKIEFANVEGKKALNEEQKAAILNGLNINKEEWNLGVDGYYYYKDKVTAGNKVFLFDKVIIPDTWGNEAADIAFELNVSAEAIQADSFEPQGTKNADGTYSKITAWTYTDADGKVVPITAENYVAPTSSNGTDNGTGNVEVAADSEE